MSSAQDTPAISCLRRWNDTATDYPRNSCLHELFDARAAEAPDAVAAVHVDRQLTYGELRDRSDALAVRLRGVGTQRGDPVAVCGDLSLDALIAFLGVLKAGAAYVPLDDTLPPARLRAMAEDAGVQVAVVLPNVTCRVRRLRARVDLSDAVGPAPEPGAGPRIGGSTPRDCAYVMFTSGSTGRPKAVAIPHRGVVRLAFADVAGSRPGPGDRVLHAYSLSSDASTIEIWSALLNGACLVLLDREELLSPATLESRLRSEGVTVAYLTTGVLHHVARTRPEALRCLRFVSAGGEAMDPDLARAVLAACPDTTLVNFYGPTENSVVSTAQVVRDPLPGAEDVPIGRPLDNSSCYVLRADGTPAVVGEQGELFVGGDGLALGYLGDPELTAERFVDNPFEPGTRLYRTGDRASWLPDGALRYHGRVDRQVKLRGRRIELDEIETRLRAHHTVGEAAVEVVRDSTDTTDAGHLIGYVTPADPNGTVSLDELRQHLVVWLPAAAIPSRLVVLQRFPVTRSGKIDRKRLAERAAENTTVVVSPAPRAATGPADVLAEIWEHTLRVRPMPADNFFAIGGDSLLAAEVVTRTLAALDMDARHSSALIRRLLRTPTLAGYADAVDELRRADASAQGADVAAPVDFEAEAALGFDLPPRQGPVPRWDAPRHVLVTGASGFVGAFLVDRLLRSTSATVHCPIRARDPRHARQRLAANLARFGLTPPEVAERVVCFPADLAAPGLGLSTEHAAELSGVLDLVIHAGAEVNFLYPYAQLRAANVNGTRAVIRLAATRRVPVHFLSTIAVVAGFGTAGVRQVDEDLPLAHADRLTMGYAESKWVAERVLQQAADQGLPVAVHRPYEITGDRRSGVCNTETAICSLFKTIAETGLAPDVPLPMDFVPVDYLADAVVHIAINRRATRRVYHLTNPNPARLGDMLDRMRAAGCEITTLPYPRWVAELVRHVAKHPTSPTAPFVSLCVNRGNKADISVKEMYFEGIFPALGRTNVERDLAGSGLHCPPVDDALLDRYLAYFFSTGYIPRPRSGAEPPPTRTTTVGRTPHPGAQHPRPVCSSSPRTKGVRGVGGRPADRDRTQPEGETR
ncbi:amino acid adenylation domain-containing protein [Allokutzneria albata]|uniref:Amino acid adenylation domain-containing protein/thioester reductase domain-containing protein n=1 Tax=Allokutzneria albata TaxID=211114 RepID=A0A1H0DE78_ALLAB|nr:amino acid adenylation domain-containing protein [Allokutzneria albata]SDN68470.1 amino acid adenylation domain-containing protein/thioester reductase domain-containing protein [Allokutzneria albata]